VLAQARTHTHTHTHTHSRHEAWSGQHTRAAVACTQRQRAGRCTHGSSKPALQSTHTHVGLVLPQGNVLLVVVVGLWCGAWKRAHVHAPVATAAYSPRGHHAAVRRRRVDTHAHTAAQHGGCPAAAHAAGCTAATKPTGASGPRVAGAALCVLHATPAPRLTHPSCARQAGKTPGGSAAAAAAGRHAAGALRSAGGTTGTQQTGRVGHGSASARGARSAGGAARRPQAAVARQRQRLRLRRTTETQLPLALTLAEHVDAQLPQPHELRRAQVRRLAHARDLHTCACACACACA
jgi:hypothetical protein